MDDKIKFLAGSDNVDFLEDASITGKDIDFIAPKANIEKPSGGSNESPKASEHESISTDELMHLRRNFYEAVKEQLPEDTTGFYPAPGVDPVPVSVFNDRVIYAGMPTDDVLIDSLKNGTKRGTIYDHYAQQYGPFPELNSMFADLSHTPLADKSVDYIILRDIPPFLLEDSNALGELERVLKPDGLLIVDTMDDKPSGLYSQLINNLVAQGYKPQEFKPFTTVDRQLNGMYEEHKMRVLKKPLQPLDNLPVPTSEV